MQAVPKSRLDGSPWLTQDANQKSPELSGCSNPLLVLTANPPSVGVPLGWLFLANYELVAEYKWNCDCVIATTSVRAFWKIQILKLQMVNGRSCFLHYTFLICCCSSNIMGIKVTLSCLGGLRFFLSCHFWPSTLYIHNPIIAMKISIGRSKAIKTLLRLRLRAWVTNFAPDSTFVK